MTGIGKSVDNLSRSGNLETASSRDDLRSGRSTPLGGSRIPVWSGSRDKLVTNSVDDKVQKFQKLRAHSDLEVNILLLLALAF